MTFKESKRKFAKTIKDKYEKEYGKDLDKLTPREREILGI